MLAVQLALAAPGIDPNVRQTVADRTVLVKTSLAVDGKATGFIWRRVGDASQIITVLTADARFAEFPKAAVVHHPGTAESKTYAARVAAYDGLSGLAVVMVDDPSLPKPFPVSTAPLTVGAGLVLGTCPHGSGARGRDDPVVSVTTMSLSAERTIASSLILQLDGDIPVGGAGGPVVLATGELVGIALAEHQDTLVSFALPIDLSQVFLGEIGRAHV